MKKPVVIVDVDSTLSLFCVQLYNRLKKDVPDIPPIEQWNKWEFWEGYMPKEQFFDIVNELHMKQMQCGVVRGSVDLLRVLKSMFTVVIASHRKEESREELQKWLDKHYAGLYDTIDLSFDKTHLFKPDVLAIVDDNPTTLINARNYGMKAFGLKYPWNTCVKDEPGIVLVDNLTDVVYYLGD